MKEELNELLPSLKAIVEHFYDAEQEDFRISQGSFYPPDHIFPHLFALNVFLVKAVGPERDQTK